MASGRQNIEEALPNSYAKKVGQLRVKKGVSDDGEMWLYAWDTIVPCTNERCPAMRLCPFDRTGQCTVMGDYIRSVQTVIFRNYDGLIDEAQMYRVGMELLPLYRNLVKFKLEELGVARVIDMDEKGRRIVHPVYKEIREHIKLIEHLWKSIGLDDFDNVPDAPPEIPTNLESIMERGREELRTGKRRIRRRQ